MNQPIVAPSLLSADFTHLADEVDAVIEGGAEWLHVDVMDGHFVPNITIGVPVVRSLHKHVGKRALLDCHLMVDRPERYVQAFADAGADVLTVHAEASVHLHRTLQAIRDAGVMAAVALNPATPLTSIQHVTDLVDMVLVMSVNPGFGGQAFIPGTLAKVKETRALVGPEVRIQVDGGVKPTNAGMIAEAGADTFVAGSAVFGTPDYAQAIRNIRSAALGE